MDYNINFQEYGRIAVEEIAYRHQEPLQDFFRNLQMVGEDQFLENWFFSGESNKYPEVSRGGNYYCVAMASGNAVAIGMIGGWEEGKFQNYIKLAVRPDFRRHGVGSVVLSHLQELGRLRGVVDIHINFAATDHVASRFFQKAGYALDLSCQSSGSRSLLTADNDRRHRRIGIYAVGLLSWGGGTDFLVNLISSLVASETSNSASLTLLVPGKYGPDSFRVRLTKMRKSFKRFLTTARWPDDKKTDPVDDLISRVRELSPEIGVLYLSNDSSALADAVDKLELDAILPMMSVPSLHPSCALVGYIYDYQHRYLKNLFSKEECSRRDETFGFLMKTCSCVFVNARDVERDIKRFEPGATAKTFVLPFTPVLRRDWIEERPEVLLKYNLRPPYFIISNQFWLHKDHLTAFRAFAEIASVWPSISLVCTGNVSDYRDPGYFKRLLEEIANLKLISRIHVLGHIPKREQIELLKRAEAVIQPTLFEGGPGGGATFDAIALDVPVLLSDLEVNKEVDCGDVRFFSKGDAKALAKLMNDLLQTGKPKPRSGEFLVMASNSRRKKCGELIWRAISDAIKRYREIQSPDHL